MYILLLPDIDRVDEATGFRDLGSARDPEAKKVRFKRAYAGILYASRLLY